MAVVVVPATVIVPTLASPPTVAWTAEVSEKLLPTANVPKLVSLPAIFRLDDPWPPETSTSIVPLLMAEPVGLPVVLITETDAPFSMVRAPETFAKFKALLEPRPLLSSMKALFPLSVSDPAIELIVPLLNSIAVFPTSWTVPVRTPPTSKPATPLVTSISAWFVPAPVRPIELDVPKLSAVVMTLLEDESVVLPTDSAPPMLSAPPNESVKPPVPPSVSRFTVPVSSRAPVVVSETLLSISRKPATSVSPVSALSELRAVLSSINALFPLSVSDPAIVAIFPETNSIALSPRRLTVPVKVPAAPELAAPVILSKACVLAAPARLIVLVVPFTSDEAVMESADERDELPRSRVPVLFSVPATVRLDPPSPPFWSSTMVP